LAAIKGRNLSASALILAPTLRMCSWTVAIVAPQKQSFSQSSVMTAALTPLGPVSRPPVQPGGFFFQ
jgi:hypothetical protein